MSGICPEFCDSIFIDFWVRNALRGDGQNREKIEPGGYRHTEPQGGARGGVPEPESTRFFSLTNVWVVQFEQM